MPTPKPSLDVIRKALVATVAATPAARPPTVPGVDQSLLDTIRDGIEKTVTVVTAAQATNDLGRAFMGENARPDSSNVSAGAGAASGAAGCTPDPSADHGTPCDLGADNLRDTAEDILEEAADMACALSGAESCAAQEVAAMRASGSVRTTANIAAARVSIDGQEPYVLRSVSGDTLRPGTVPNVGDPHNPQRLIPQVWPTGGKNNRFADTEFKILNDLANRLGQPSESVRGKVHLHTERPVCGSCETVIAQFKSMFPNIDLTITKD